MKIATLPSNHGAHFAKVSFHSINLRSTPFTKEFGSFHQIYLLVLISRLFNRTKEAQFITKHKCYLKLILRLSLTFQSCLIFMGSKWSCFSDSQTLKWVFAVEWVSNLVLNHCRRMINSKSGEFLAEFLRFQLEYLIVLWCQSNYVNNKLPTASHTPSSPPSIFFWIEEKYQTSLMWVNKPM